ncbi:MAG TPA: flagellar export protein FliJ [Steroidobacteraceae bacterium]|nr:flagellar export protein FliJ [Steroidobacteraceae bacterium]
MSLDRRPLVQRVAEDMERQLARRLAASRARVAQCESQLAELESYRRSYREELSRRTDASAGAEELQELAAFLARLDQAVHQQTDALKRARAERDAERRYWSPSPPPHR